MLTKQDICSMALLKLGEQPIQSLQDDSTSAKLSRTLYDSVTDSLIALHPWKFALSEITLNKTTAGYFIIPSDVLRVLKSSGRIIGNKIYSDEDTLIIKAIIRTASEHFPAYFASLAATRLAMEFCIPITGDQTMFRTLVSLYETELQAAKYIDSSSIYAQSIDNFSLINARF